VARHVRSDGFQWDEVADASYRVLCRQLNPLHLAEEFPYKLLDVRNYLERLLQAPSQLEALATSAPLMHK
jgi:hypothetical protein